MKGLFIHVASDHSTKPYVCGPIYSDNTFEYIPIIESDIHAVGRKFVEVPTRFPHHGSYISELIPQEYEKRMVHFDPDLIHGTHGERYGSMRSTKVAWLNPCDFLFFVASLAPFDHEVYTFRNVSWMQSHQRGRMRKAIIGYFQVEGVYYVEKRENDGLIFEEGVSPSAPTLERILKNAHSQRSKDEFLVVVADGNSCFLPRAIVLTEAGSPFRPNEVGRQIYGDLAFPRGFKWLNEEQVRAALKFCREVERY